MVNKVPKCVFCGEVHVYKDKDDRYKCTSFKGINLVSVVGKVNGKVLIKTI